MTTAASTKTMFYLHGGPMDGSPMPMPEPFPERVSAYDIPPIDSWGGTAEIRLPTHIYELRMMTGEHEAFIGYYYVRSFE